LSPILGISNLEEMLSQSQEEAAKKESQATKLAEEINKAAGIEIVRLIPAEEAQQFLKQFQTATTPPVGPRPDGTFGMVVTIPEGMIEPIREQAQSDGITPEQWVSLRLQECFDVWWYPTKGR